MLFVPSKSNRKESREGSSFNDYITSFPRITIETMTLQHELDFFSMDVASTEKNGGIKESPPADNLPRFHKKISMIGGTIRWP